MSRHYRHKKGYLKSETWRIVKRKEEEQKAEKGQRRIKSSKYPRRFLFTVHEFLVLHNCAKVSKQHFEGSLLDSPSTGSVPHFKLL
jgi:hypothetical protein